MTEGTDLERPTTRTGVPLYALARHAHELDAALDDVAVDAVSGAISDEDAIGRGKALDDALTALGEGIQVKADSILRIIRNKEAHATALEVEQKRLGDVAKVARNAAGQLRKYLFTNLAAIDETKQSVETTVGKVTVGKRPDKDAVEIVNEAELPAAYKKATLQVPLDKVPADWQEYVTGVAVNKALLNSDAQRDGLCPPGATFVAATRRLTIS